MFSVNTFARPVQRTLLIRSITECFSSGAQKTYQAKPAATHTVARSYTDVPAGKLAPQRGGVVVVVVQAAEVEDDVCNTHSWWHCAKPLTEQVI